MYGDKELKADLHFFLKEIRDLNAEVIQLKSKHNSKSERDLYRKLQELKQGSMSVEDYYHEMELAMIKAGVKETPKATMDRFIHGLNPKLASFVEMCTFMEIANLVPVIAKYEQEIKKKRNQKSKNMSDSKRKIELEREKVIECKECCSNIESKNKSVELSKKDENCEKSEVKSDCKDISLITNDHNHSFPCVSVDLQVFGDLFLKKPTDGFLSLGSIESSPSSCIEKYSGGLNFVIPDYLLNSRYLELHKLNFHCYMNFVVHRCPYYMNVVVKRLSYYLDFVVALGYVVGAQGIQIVIYIWVHVRKKRFLMQSKFQQLPKIKSPNMTLRNQDSFHALEITKIPPFGKYCVYIIFENSNFFPFDAGQDSRTNLFEEGENDSIPRGIQYGGYKGEETFIQLEVQQALQDAKGD